jgi:hypothetical protein
VDFRSREWGMVESIETPIVGGELTTEK